MFWAISLRHGHAVAINYGEKFKPTWLPEITNPSCLRTGTNLIRETRSAYLDSCYASHFVIAFSRARPITPLAIAKA